MVFNDFNKNDFYSIFPNTGIKLNTLSEEEQNEYMSLSNAYRKMLSEVFIKKYNLKELDNAFINSNLHFVTADSKKMDCYQNFSSNELKYFYIRNNVYVERLSKEDKSFIKRIIDSNDFSMTDEIEQFIDRTYSEVIKEDVSSKDGEKVFVQFGPDSRSYIVPNDSIVIGFNYDEFADNGLTDDEWYERHLKQLDFMVNTLNDDIRLLNENSNHLVNILKYNEYSILKRKSD